MSTARPMQRPQTYEFTVAEVRPETHDTATLYLDRGGPPPPYRAGQFLNVDPHQFRALAPLAAFLHEQKGRKEQARSYSLASAPHEPRLAITVKDEGYTAGSSRYPPLLSPYLVHGRLEGQRLKVQGFLGPYVLPEDVEERTGHVVHLIAGSGAVPNFSILKDALHRGLRVRHTVVCSNKTWKDVLYRESLEALEKTHPEKLRVVHALTREQDVGRYGARVHEGRVTLALLEEWVTERESCLVYVCGPSIPGWERRKALEAGTSAAPRFLETMMDFLHALGIPDTRIKRESFG